MHVGKFLHPNLSLARNLTHMTTRTCMPGLTKKKWRRQSMRSSVAWSKRKREALRTCTPSCPSYPCPPLLLDVPLLWTRLLRLASCLNMTMIWLIGSRPQSFSCTVMPKSTGNISFQVVILKIFWGILCYPNMSCIYLGINQMDSGRIEEGHRPFKTG